MRSSMIADFVLEQYVKGMLRYRFNSNLVTSIRVDKLLERKIFSFNLTM